jgi:RNA polymerase sigma-70 factor, ECF subfamily
VRSAGRSGAVRLHVPAEISVPTANSNLSRPMTNAASDEELFASFLNGEDHAFHEIFVRHNRPLYFYAIKFVKDSAAAEDLTQSLWEKVIELRATSPKITNVGGFLVRSLRNLTVDYLRRQRFETPIIDDYERILSSPLEILDEREAIVLECLELLSEEQKELLVLHYYSGYSFEEIAAMLAKKPNAIWTRASRAREALKRLIEGRMKTIANKGVPA